MKKEITQIAFIVKRGFALVNTFGYPTSTPGLYVTRDINSYKSYSLTHTKSGFGFLLEKFKSIKEAREIVDMFLAEVDWTQPYGSIITDETAKGQALDAQTYLLE